MTPSRDLASLPSEVQVNVRALAERWWTVALRGIAALVFGGLTLFWPGVSLFALVTLFGAFALVDGVFTLAMSVRSARHGRRWGWLMLAGLAGVAAGLVTFAWPRITVLVLMLLIAAWAIVTGVAEIAAAIRLRKEMRGEWLLGLSGVLSIALGVLLLLFPKAGAFMLMIWIGAFALLLGVLLIALAFELRAFARRSDRYLPGAPAMPSPTH